LNEIENNPSSSHRSPWISILLLLLVIMGGFLLVGPMIGMLFAIPFMEGSIFSLLEMMQSPAGHPELKLPLYIIQGTSTFIGLIVGPSIFFLINKKESAKVLFNEKKVLPIALLLTGVVVIFFMIPNSAIIEWNANLEFPSWFESFERWARSREDLAAEITTFLTTFDTLGEFTIALMVVALLPAIGEELVFRGMFQREIEKGTGKYSHLVLCYSFQCISHAILWIYPACTTRCFIWLYVFLVRQSDYSRICAFCK